VVCLSRAWLPGRALPGHDRRRPIKVSDYRPVNPLVKGKQCGVVGQELPDGDHFFAVLGELRPVSAHAFIVIEPAARMRERKSCSLGCPLFG
jgi:hypothetical protein